MVNKTTFSFLKLDIRENFIKKLYNFSLQKILKDIRKLVKENSLLYNKIDPTKSKYNCVYYKGDYFFEEKYNKMNYTIIIEKYYFTLLEIHPNLEKQFNFLFKELDCLMDEKSKNIIYINQVLNISKNIADVYALIPTPLHKYIEYHSKDLITNLTTLGDSVIKQHKEKHIKPRIFLKERLIIDLLLRNN